MAEGRLNPREQARMEELQKSRKTRAKYIAAGIVLALMIALVVFVNSSLFTDGLTALKVGDMKYTVADVNYQYQSGYNEFTQENSSYLTFFFDPELPLSEQECMFLTEGGTWDDYFKNNAESALTELTAYYTAARDAGYALTEEDEAQIDGLMETYSLYSQLYGYDDLDGFLAANFGAGNNEKTIRRNMGIQLVVENYLNDLNDSFTYTPEELDAYFEENASTLGRVSFLYKFTVNSDTVNGQETSDEILAAMDGEDEDAFRAAVLSVTGTEATSTYTSPAGFLSQYTDGLTADDLTSGTVFTHATESGCYAIYVIGVDDLSYNTVSVRHILIQAEDTDGDGAISDEEMAAAYDSIVAIRDEWLAGEATEESFATLAEVYSEDTGSYENGGLYEEIFKGQMVEEFDEFCFAGHEPGDYDIISDEQYSGYHLIYFVGEGELYSRILADGELRSAAYNEAIAALTEGFTAERGIMWRYVMSK